MSDLPSAEAVLAWLPDLGLGRDARTKRFAKVVETLVRKPGHALPEVFPERSQPVWSSSTFM